MSKKRGGGYCPDARYRGKLQEKETQHEACEGTLKEYGHNVTTHCLSSSDNLGQYRATTYALAQIGTENAAVSKVMSNNA